MKSVPDRHDLAALVWLTGPVRGPPSSRGLHSGTTLSQPSNSYFSHSFHFFLFLYYSLHTVRILKSAINPPNSPSKLKTVRASGLVRTRRPPPTSAGTSQTVITRGFYSFPPPPFSVHAHCACQFVVVCLVDDRGGGRTFPLR